MKNLVIVLFVLGIATVCKVQAQAPPLPQLVISPQLFQPLAEMEDMQKRLRDLRTNAAFVANLGSFQKFASVIEKTRCSTMNLQNLIAQLEGRNSRFLHSCRFELGFNTGVYRLAGVSDMTNSILSAMSMEPGDRLKLTLDTMREFDNVQVKILSLNKELEKELEEEIAEEKRDRQKEWALKSVY